MIQSEVQYVYVREREGGRGRLIVRKQEGRGKEGGMYSMYCIPLESMDGRKDICKR